MKRGRLAAGAAIGMVLCAWPARATLAQIRIQFITPEERVAEFFAAQDYSAAAAYIDDQLSRRPDDAFMLYNLACARSRLGELDPAAALLMRAIKAGFNDFSIMRRDDDLAAIRDHRTFTTLIAALDAANDLIAQRQLELCLQQMDRDRYQVDRESLPGVTIVSGIDVGGDDAGLASIVRDHLQTTSQLLFEGAGLSQRINLVLPSAADAASILNRRHAGGVYRHNQRLLIALDRSTSLRHELVHALHQCDMDRRGQQHPLWIEEGLALLLEDYQRGSCGVIDVLPTERDNIARVMLRNGNLIPWTTLMADDHAVALEPVRSYPQLRSMFRFLHERFGIGTWYSTYVDTFTLDHRGASAMERLSGTTIGELESQWKSWLASQPIVIGEPRTARGANTRQGMRQASQPGSTERRESRPAPAVEFPQPPAW